MPNPSEYHFILPKNTRPNEILLNDPWYPGVQECWSNCTTKRSVNPVFGITTVVIHATAGSTSSGAISVMKKEKGAASFHWLVPDEDEPQHGNFVWACVPEALAAWHVRNLASNAEINGGATRVNHWSLGIEVVNAQKNDPFSDWQIEAAANIVKYCWAKYPNLVHVVSHAKLDPKRRSDPGVNFDWERMKRLVLDSGSGSIHRLVALATPLPVIEPTIYDDCCNT